MAGEVVFVGRAVLLRTLETGLAQGRSFALYGGPRTGRTSILKQLVHKARQRLARPQLGAKIVPVYVDLATCPLGRLQSLVAHLWTAVRDTVMDPFVQVNPNPPRPGKADPNRSSDPWPVLYDLLGELWGGMANTPGWCRTVWLLDNADRLTPGAWKDADAVLSTLAHGPETWRPLGMVLAGGPAWQQIVQKPKSPWAELRSQSLGVLRDAEVGQLVKAGGGGNAEALAPLVQASGKHPQVLQCLLWSRAEAEGNTNAMLELARPHLQATFEAILKTFPPRQNRRGEVALEHQLMALLIDQGADVPLADAEAALHRGPLKGACDLLEQNAVVERLVRGSNTVLRAGCSLWNSYYSSVMSSS